MPDENSPSGASETPAPRRPSETHPLPSANGLHPPATDMAGEETARAPRRVYEPTLLPTRKRRRVSRWVVIPGLFVILGAGLYALYIAQHARRFVATAGQIVYASDQGMPGQTHLWIAQADGSGARRMTTQAASETNPSYSHDGDQIAFVQQAQGSIQQVYTIDGDGKGLSQVTRNTGTKESPAFAPSDPTLIGFTAAGLLKAADTHTGAAEQLLPPQNQHTVGGSTDAGTPDATITVPTFVWAPAKEREQQGLAAVLDQSSSIGQVQTLAIMPTLTGQILTSHGGQANGPPLAAAQTLSLAWSPDGGLLAVAMLGMLGLPEGQSESAIVLFNAQGDVLPQKPLASVTTATTGPQDPIFSPDGTQIVFELLSQPDLTKRKSLGLFVVPVDGTTPPKMIYKGLAEHAVFLPDGSHLLFLKARPDGKHDLCEINLDGTGFHMLSDGTADVTGIAVSPQAPKA